MTDARHTIVEEPDGSVSVAFNEDVPPPPPPPRPPEMVRIRRVVNVWYHPAVKVMGIGLFIAACLLVYALRKVLDVINLVLVIATNISLHLKNRPYSIIQPTVHGTGSGLMFIPFCVFHMWGRAAFQFGCAVTCLFAVSTSEDEIVIESSYAAV